jgi:hypothetical protein
MSRTNAAARVDSPDGSTRRQQKPVAIIRIARFRPEAERPTAAAPAPAIVNKPRDLTATDDALGAFGSETAVEKAVENEVPQSTPIEMADVELEGAIEPVAASVVALRAPARSPSATLIGIIALLLVIAGTTGWAYRNRTAPPSASGSLTVQTNPAGLAVVIDGKPAGVTPLTVNLAAASYALQIGEGDRRRELTVEIAAGTNVRQYLEFASVAAPAATVATGALIVQTEPSGQTVSVDDVQRGSSPLSIEALAAGEHRVSVHSSGRTVKRTVIVKAGETVTLLVAPSAPSAPAPGWLTVQSPVRLDIRQAGKLLGTSDTPQIMLAAGGYDIELVNDAIGYRSRQRFEVSPGQTTTLPIELPSGTVSLNAQPWAEVWLNGERVGETPIANLSKRIGSYEVLFRHPEFGERRETINVTLREPVRLGVDMRSKRQ